MKCFFLFKRGYYSCVLFFLFGCIIIACSSENSIFGGNEFDKKVKSIDKVVVMEFQAGLETGDGKDEILTYYSYENTVAKIKVEYQDSTREYYYEYMRPIGYKKDNAIIEYQNCTLDHELEEAIYYLSLLDQLKD